MNEDEEPQDDGAAAWAAELRAMGYPRRMVVDQRNKHWQLFQNYYDRQYLNECARLGIEPSPKQDTLL